MNPVWDRSLQRLLNAIVESMEPEDLPPGDRAVLAVLIVLHNAVKGDIDVEELAIRCIEFQKETLP